MAENQGEFYKLWVKYKLELDIFWRMSCAFLVLVIVGYFYYRLMVPFNQRTATDVIYIFTCAASLLGPIALVLTLGAWKGQHNKNLSKDVALACWDAVNLNVRLLEDLIIEYNRLGSAQFPAEVRIRIKELSDLFDKAKYSAISHTHKVRALCDKNFPTEDYAKAINSVGRELTRVKNGITHDIDLDGSIRNYFRQKSNDTLKALEVLIRA